MKNIVLLLFICCILLISGCSVIDKIFGNDDDSDVLVNANETFGEITGDREVYFMDSDGGNLFRVTDNAAQDWCPVLGN